MHFIRPLSALWLAWSIISVSHAEPNPVDVSKSWTDATVYVPGKFFATTTASVEIDKAVPVVLFMHGCSGIKKTEPDWAYFLKNNGYIVVLPNSFARERPLSCDPVAKRGGLFPGVIGFRRDEIRYALEQLQSLPWVDKKNIFLMGHSEGGALTALSAFSGFKGVIISGWPCTGARNPEYNGIKVPADTPLLVLNHEHDPWYLYVAGRKCSEFFGDRKNAKEIILAGNEHFTFEPPAKEAVLDFLKQYRDQ